MSVYRPSYLDKVTGETKQQKIWWYHFNFAGRHIQESSKSTRKTIAVEAEKKRRLELEKAFNDTTDRRQERIRTITELADKFLEDYKLRNPDSTTFATYALGHLKRHLGKTMTVDVSVATVTEYQTARLKEKASNKSINDEVVFLLRILGEQGDYLRAKLRRTLGKNWKLSTRPRIGRAFSEEEKAALLAEARARRSRTIYPALTLALHAGLRDKELRGLQWERVDLVKAVVRVAKSKTEAGEGRRVPLNANALDALVEYSKWYLGKFGETKGEWFVFPHGQPQPTDPTRPVTSFKTVWSEIREKTGIKGRWHDARHTWKTDLGESPDATPDSQRAMGGWSDDKMLKHYDHARMEAKRKAVASLERAVKTPEPADTSDSSAEPAKESAKVEVLN